MTALPLSRETSRHERLRAWHACYDLLQAVYLATGRWSSFDQHTLGRELRDTVHEAARAIVAGADAPTPTGFVRHLTDAEAKMARLSAGVRLARDLGLLKAKDYGEIEALRDHAVRLTAGLRRAVKRRADAGPKRPARPKVREKRPAG